MFGALDEAMGNVKAELDRLSITDRFAPAPPPEQTIADHRISRTYVNGQLETVVIDDYYEATEWFHCDIRTFLEEKFDWCEHDKVELD